MVHTMKLLFKWQFSDIARFHTVVAAMASKNTNPTSSKLPIF